MQLIKNQEIIKNGWVLIADNVPIPDQGRIIVTLQRFKSLMATDLSPIVHLGVSVTNTDDISFLQNEFHRIDLIRLNFPAFTDGRAFSQARILRHQLKFEGDIRISGEFILDQVHFLEKCGATSFEVADDVGLENWIRVTRSLNYSYQPGYSLADTRMRGSKPTITADNEDHERATELSAA